MNTSETDKKLSLKEDKQALIQSGWRHMQRRA